MGLDPRRHSAPWRGSTLALALSTLTRDSSLLLKNKYSLRSGWQCWLPRMRHQMTRMTAPLEQAGETPWLISSSWTDVLPQTDHTNLFVNIPWDETPLGAIANWGAALRFASTLVFADSRPACVFWGPKRIAIYNERFKILCRNAHPRAMGAPHGVTFPEVVDEIEPLFQSVCDTGQTYDMNDFELFTDRKQDGYLEETYFVGQFIPLRGDDGNIGGILNTVTESTDRVCRDRWQQALNAIADVHPGPVNQTLCHAMDQIRTIPRDVPFAALFAASDSSSDNSVMHLVDSIGVPATHFIATRTALDLSSDNDTFVRLARNALESDCPLVIDYKSLVLIENEKHIFDELDWVGFGEAPRHIVLECLRDPTGSNLGLLVSGTNPRRPLEDDGQLWFRKLARQLEVKWMSCISLLNAQEREANLERNLTESQRTLNDMAQKAPIGMLRITADGAIEWANDQMYDITGHRKSNQRPDLEEFLETLVPEDRLLAQTRLGTMLVGAAPTVTIELRLKRTWTPPMGPNSSEPVTEVNAWILCTGYSVFENGEVMKILGFIADISAQKWAEEVQARNANASARAKRLQEEFIDMTSHEMRNPLTAMLQLSASIADCMNDNDEQSLTLSQSLALLENNVDDARTMLACAQHQKRIIDDVLILSRLDSEMLSISLVPERPREVVDRALRMFAAAMSKSDIRWQFDEDSSMKAHGAEYIMCDPSRLLQILLNLIGNAVKFAAKREIRKLSVTFGAQKQTPRLETDFGEIKWLPQRTNQDMLKTDDQSIYVYFLVQDTGPGLQTGEVDELFKRFSQGHSKSSAHYEGSGLGLYIVRQFVEKQGGQVGVTTQKGCGSVFGFYIKTTKVDVNGVTRSPTVAIDSLHHKKGCTSIPKELLLEYKKELSQNGIPDSLPCYNILLVEDNLINQKVLAKQLSKLGCTVTVAAHGLEALGLLRQFDCWQDDKKGIPSGIHDHSVSSNQPKNQLDILVMDWEMPVMNGLECARNIRQLQASGQIARKLPIICVTANVRPEQIEIALSAGIDRVLSKPFQVQSLISMIKELLETEN